MGNTASEHQNDLKARLARANLEKTRLLKKYPVNLSIETQEHLKLIEKEIYNLERQLNGLK
jgi:hypothetical protein